jgi:type II secretory pathway component PulC
MIASASNGKRLRGTLLATVASVVCAGAVIAADPPPRNGNPSRNGGSRNATAAPSTREGDRDRYAVLTNQNIFLKDRRTGRGDRNGTSGTSRPSDPLAGIRATPEASLVLTGVVFEDGDYRAFIEDTKASKVLRVSVGDSIARGKITMIDIDTVVYDSDGKSTMINVGTTLTGIPYSAFTATPGATPAAGASSTPLPDPNNPNLTLEERMKLRRAAELQKK